VFSSEWDKYAQITYEANFGEKPYGDITKINSIDIPEHNILVAGFPCQPFSISGVSKKRSLKKPDGFKDEKQGNLFWEIRRIIKDKKPNAFLLENVKHLKRHDHGNTYKIIIDTLKDELNYHVFDKVIDADLYVPQHRERIFIVGFRDYVDYVFPDPRSNERPKFRDILEDNVPDKYTLSDHLWDYLQHYAKKHKAKGNGFGFGLADLEGRSRTLSARYYKDGSEILIPQFSKRKNPRRLTPYECAKLMGFIQFRPDYKIPVSDTQAYKQFGNSVVIPVVYDIAKTIVSKLKIYREEEDTKMAGG